VPHAGRVLGPFVPNGVCDQGTDPRTASSLCCARSAGAGLVLLATFASLRWGEAIALTRNDIDLVAPTVSVRRQYVELTGQLVLGPPKSHAGTRTVINP
jgi:integrase